MKNYLIVSTYVIDIIISKINEFGALGTKITGCGLGGYIVSAVAKENSLNFENKLKELKVDYQKCWKKWN